MAYPGETKYQTANRRLQEMKATRQSYDDHAKEISRFFEPWRGRWGEDTKGSRGSKKNQQLIDPTAKMALRTLAAGMMSGSTNPATAWFQLRTPDPELMEAPSVSRWLYAVENRMRDVFDRSNFYAVLPQVYTETGAFGTNPILIVEDDEDVIRCIDMTFGTYWIAANQKGVIDTLYREIEYTTRQMVQEFGLENLSPQIQAMVKQNEKEKIHKVLHCIEPRKDSIFGSAAAKDMPWASVYFDMDYEEKPIKESGFEENPLACFRWATVPGDVYGYSPAMDALGSAKALQVQTKRKAQAIDKHIDPPLIGDPNAKNEPASLLPGDITYAGFSPTGGQPRLQPLYEIKPDINALLQDIDDTRNTLNDCMYVQLFLMFTTMDRRQITAEEIRERAGEKLLMLGPTLGNHKTGLIEPAIDRTFSIMARRGMFPDPPPELEGIALKVELVSPLAVAQKGAMVSSMDRFTMFVAGLAKAQADSGQQPTVFDKVDFDQSVDEFALMTGVPPTIIRSDDEVDAMRQDRAEAQRQQQAAQSAPLVKDTAQAAKTLSETQVGGQSMLERLAGAA